MGYCAIVMLPINYLDGFDYYFVQPPPGGSSGIKYQDNTFDISNLKEFLRIHKKDEMKIAF